MVGQRDESAWSLKGALHSSSNSFSDPFGISFPPYHMQLVFCLQLPLACSPGAGVFITVNVQVDGGGIREGIMQVGEIMYSLEFAWLQHLGYKRKRRGLERSQLCLDLLACKGADIMACIKLLLNNGSIYIM